MFAKFFSLLRWQSEAERIEAQIHAARVALASAAVDGDGDHVAKLEACLHRLEVRLVEAVRFERERCAGMIRREGALW